MDGYHTRADARRHGLTISDPDYREGKERLSQPLRSLIEEGQQITAFDYLASLDRRAALGPCSRPAVREL